MNLSGKAVLAIVAVFLAAFTLSCATAQKESAFLGPYAKNLQPGPEGGAKLRWVKPATDFGKYNGLMVDNVLFYFAEDSESKAIDAEKLKELQDIFNQEFVQALRDNKIVNIVAQPGPRIARIRVAVTDLKLNNQALSVLSTVTSLTPIGLGVNLVKRGATGTWAGSGLTKAEFMVLDSATSEVLAVAADEQAAGLTERYTEMGSVKAAFRFWGERLAKNIEQLRSGKR